MLVLSLPVPMDLSCVALLQFSFDIVALVCLKCTASIRRLACSLALDVGLTSSSAVYFL